jgi:hypothetical protein
VLTEHINWGLIEHNNGSLPCSLVISHTDDTVLKQHPAPISIDHSALSVESQGGNR